MHKETSCVHGSNDISFMIWIWWKTHFQIVWYWLLQNFAHATAAKLSWHVQILLSILPWLGGGWKYCKRGEDITIFSPWGENIIRYFHPGVRIWGGGWKYRITGIITMSSHECHGFSNYWQLDCFFNSLFRLTTKETSKLCTMGYSWSD